MDQLLNELYASQKNTITSNKFLDKQVAKCKKELTDTLNKNQIAILKRYEHSLNAQAELSRIRFFKHGFNLGVCARKEAIVKQDKEKKDSQ